MEDAIPSTGPFRTLVNPSISHAEFGRLLQKFGYDAESVNEEGRIGYRTLTEPRFTAWMQTPFKGRPGEFASVFLFECVKLPVVISAAVIRALRSKTMCAHVDMDRRGGLAAMHTLVVCGGITEYFLRNQLWYWKRDLERIQNEVRKHSGLLTGSTVH
jgi:hypothetical protein